MTCPLAVVSRGSFSELGRGTRREDEGRGQGAGVAPGVPSVGEEKLEVVQGQCRGKPFLKGSVLGINNCLLSQPPRSPGPHSTI